jgi:hypothetical protein
MSRILTPYSRKHTCYFALALATKGRRLAENRRGYLVSEPLHVFGEAFRCKRAMTATRL